MSDPQASTSRFDAIRFDPNAIWRSIWNGLEEGVRTNASPWRLGTLATVTETGEPDARTVVLRHTDQDRRELWFHTDARSPKVGQLANRPDVVWLFYDPNERVQLRIRARATLHRHDSLAEDCWNESPAARRQAYAAPASPGTEFNTPFINFSPTPETASEAISPGRQNFVVVVTQTESIDWVYLHRQGHLRLRFEVDPQDPQVPPRGIWLAS